MTIILKRLTQETFKNFGQAIIIQDKQNPDIIGDGWDCWYPIGSIIQEQDLLSGIVLTRPKSHQVKFMERHLDRVEYIISLDHPIIQVVSLSDPEHPDIPSNSKTEAFFLSPGQIVMINKGVWHSAALAFSQELTKYLFLLGKASESSENYDSGLVPFLNEQVIEIDITGF